MHYFEIKLFNLVHFPFYTRYIDYSFALVDLSQYNNKTALDLLNSIGPRPCI